MAAEESASCNARVERPLPGEDSAFNRKGHDMMRANYLYRVGNSIAAGLAACALVLGAANAYCDTGQGPFLEARIVALGAADLEKAFWICDHAATTDGVDATPVDICGAVYDELKARKFEGDFERLLAWWRQNKPAEHGRLATER
jgi:hypothetical protein